MDNSSWGDEDGFKHSVCDLPRDTNRRLKIRTVKSRCDGQGFWRESHKNAGGLFWFSNMIIFKKFWEIPFLTTNTLTLYVLIFV